MDGQTAQTQNPQVSSSSSVNSGPKLFLPLVLLFCLAMGVAIGFWGNRLLRPKVEPTTANLADQLPIGASLLKNPLIRQWRGSIEGTLVAKSEDSIVMRDDKGNSLTIPLRVSEGAELMTFFYDTTEATASGAPSVKIEQIPLESYMRGDFFVVPGKGSSQIVGSSFAVVKKP